MSRYQLALRRLDLSRIPNRTSGAGFPNLNLISSLPRPILRRLHGPPQPGIGFNKHQPFLHFASEMADRYILCLCQTRQAKKKENISF